MSYFVQCNVCNDYTTASYDAEGFRWMEKHDETCPEPTERSQADRREAARALRDHGRDMEPNELDPA